MPLPEIIQNLFTGGDKFGPGLFSPGNIGRAAQDFPRQLGQEIPNVPGRISNIAQNMPTPMSKQEQFARGMATNTAKLVGDFYGGLEGIPEENRETFAKDFLRSLQKQQQQGQPGTVQAAQPQEAPTPVAPKTAQAETPPADTEGKPNVLWEVLKRVGVPGLAAILGSTGAMPLAGAAGLGTGFVKGQLGAEATEREGSAAAGKQKIEVAKLQLNAAKAAQKAEQDKKLKSGELKVLLEHFGKQKGLFGKIKKEAKASIEKIIKKYIGQDVTQADIEATIKAHPELTREEVIQRISQ